MSFTVAIVGRPNVGKSTLFNRIIGKRISIVDDKPGVTRDRIYGRTEWNGKKFTVVDTGGIEPSAKDVILSQMKRQADFAIETADVILFLVDAKDGLTPADEDVAGLLRRSGKPVILVVNKVDNFEMRHELYEFYELGFGEPIFISAIHGLAIGDLLDKVTGFIKDEGDFEYDEDTIKVAVVGKPNVGKSSLVNAILGEERVIVSEIPGTTRDAIDTFFEVEGKKMVLIDTAGMRRKSKVKEDIEFYSNVRAIAAIERSDVVLMVLDATQEISEQDKRIAGMAHESGKGIIIVVNKWDLIEKDDKTVNRYREKIRNEFAFMQYAPIVFISAKTGQRVRRILELINFVMDQYTFRVKTSMLNELVEEATALVEPPSFKGRKLKIYYAVQTGIKPPTFVFFINDLELFHFSYARFLENKLRETFGLEGTPVVIKAKEKKEVAR
ncbi:ribosome biogenesis GTPase Der [Thermoanaerobacterium sp. DL9XJH110]|uniref:ribosome biogenesis GTPase Der n=1 Tax=Thermoanaerobacterium sp. DL9XJH110 TaxID=3386643 RepID=UPI003BB798E4